MTDELKGRLERLGERADQGGDALERLRGARDRRDRRRARSALVVGISVFVVVGLIAVTTMRDPVTAPVPKETPSPTEAWALPETPYLWPENWARIEDRELLANVQAAADAGDPEVAWRLDPEEVVRRFLQTVLAWEELSIMQEVYAPGPGRTWGVAPTCQGPTLCDQDANLEVSVYRPIPGGDIWSVLQVTSDDLAIRSSQGQSPDLRAGESVGFELRLSDDRSAHAGLVASNGCREASEFAVGLSAGPASLQVPAAEADDPSCGAVGAGYLFVYAMDDTTVPTGDPLLEAAAIEYPWLTMVPVEVQMSADAVPDADLPAVAVIECTGSGIEGTRVLTPVVVAQPDGVHVEVRNTSNVDLGISFSNRGDNADVGTTRLVLDFPPGPEEAMCLGSDTDPGDPGVPFEIVDPNGYWVSTELAGMSCATANIDYGELPQGIADPIEAAGEALGDRVVDGDELIVAGYPEATQEKVVLLRRDGVAIASVALFEGTEGWIEHTVTTCS